MSSEIRSYKDLHAWQLAMDLAEACYNQTMAFPAAEAHGMTSQIRRAAVSIPANIAEGYGRESTGSYVQFLRVAQGSLKELETLLLLCGRVDLIGAQTAASLLETAESVSKMLRNLIRSLQRVD